MRQANLAIALKGLYPFARIVCHDRGNNESSYIEIDKYLIFMPTDAFDTFQVLLTSEYGESEKTYVHEFATETELIDHIHSAMYLGNAQRIYNILLENNKEGVMLNLAFAERLYEWWRKMELDLVQSPEEWDNYSIYKKLSDNIKKYILIK